MTINTLKPFGVAISGMDIRQPTKFQAMDLRKVIAENGFAVFKNQQIDDTAFVDFLRQLGTLTFTKGEKAVADFPDLNIVTNVGRSRPPRSVWHTDTSYVKQPPAFTALRIIETPKSGGATLISDMYAVFEALPERMKERLATSKVLHQATGVEDATTTWHPLFRRHPLSNRVSLFLSTPARCTALSERTIAESEQIITALYEFAQQERFVYEHQWEENDILIWDNRCTLHRGDHSETVGNRTLHRGMVAGEIPIAAFEYSLV